MKKINVKQGAMALLVLWHFSCLYSTASSASVVSGSNGTLVTSILLSTMSSFGDDPEGDIESNIEDDVESNIEDDVEANIEDDVESNIEDDVEANIEDDVESNIEDDVESNIEDDVEANIEDDVEANIEDDVEANIEDDVESNIEDDVESNIEDDVEDNIEDDVESNIEDDVESNIEDDVEDDVEDNIEDDVEANIEDDVVGEMEDDVEREVEDDQGDDQRYISDDDLEQPLSLMQIDVTESTLDDVVTLSVDFENQKIFTDDWLVLTTKQDSISFVQQGYTLLNQYPLPSLDKILLRVKAPASFKFDQNGKRLIDGLNTPIRAVDLNTVYTLSGQTDYRQADFVSPRDLLKIPYNESSRRIGMVDTGVNIQHPSFTNAKITSTYFSETNDKSAQDHGTAVAAILVGKDEHFQGLLDNAELFAAGVFFDHSAEGVISTVASLVKALDFLVKQNVEVINLSLAGPPNVILQRVISEYCEKGVTIVAAVGNLGPNAPALYPAAYDCVIGVTAIDSQERIYRRAIRGEHVDIATYGVGIWSANGTSGYQSMTGTSFAAPFVSAFVLSNLPKQEAHQRVKLETLFSNLKDLGEPGRDVVYGVGGLTQSSFE